MMKDGESSVQPQKPLFLFADGTLETKRLMIDDSYLSSYKWCLMKFNGKFIMGETELEKWHFSSIFFFLFSMCELAYSLKKEEWHASWFMRHFCLLRTFLRTLFWEIIRRVDQEKKDAREIVTLTKSEVFFQLWQEKNS